jgi:fermentation-respiration switch protein FrsA (DUF1100 family)
MEIVDMRTDISFMSCGLRCDGWLYVPDGISPGQKAPAIVMAHGFSGVKEAYLPRFAEQFVAAGFVTLVFDYRYLGASEGNPRSQIIWYEQIEDYRNAITWISEQPHVDPTRVGIWGTSYSGAHVLQVGAYDKRAKAVVSQVHGGVSMWDIMQYVLGAAELAQFLEFLEQDRRMRYRTGAINYMKIVAPEGEPAALNAPGAYELFTGEQAQMAPNWCNQVSIESLEKMLEYDVTAAMQRLSPTPLRMILAEKDELIPIDLARNAYEHASEPKDLLILPCGHFDVYHKEPWFSKASGAAVEWFREHLLD